MSYTEILIYYALPLAFALLIIFLNIALYYKKIPLKRAFYIQVYSTIFMLMTAMILETFGYFGK